MVKAKVADIVAFEKYKEITSPSIKLHFYSEIQTRNEPATAMKVAPEYFALHFPKYRGNFVSYKLHDSSQWVSKFLLILEAAMCGGESISGITSLHSKI